MIWGTYVGLPSSAYITDWVRSCLFTGGVLIHVTECWNLLTIPLCHFGHSVSSSFAVLEWRYFFICSSHMLTIPVKPNSSIVWRYHDWFSSRNTITGYIVRTALHKPVTRFAHVRRLLGMEPKVWSVNSQSKKSNSYNKRLLVAHSIFYKFHVKDLFAKK